MTISTCIVVFLQATAAIAASAANPAPQPRKCPLTQVDRYNYYCNTKGSLKAPAKLSASKTSKLLNCAEKCEANKACKSYQYIQSTSECQLYSKYLVYMEFNATIKGEGIFSERDCYTRDCNVIDSCAATDQCLNEEDYFSVVIYEDVIYERYACDYGHTARTFGFNFTDHDINNSTDPNYSSYDLSTACGAVEACFSAATLQSPFFNSDNVNPGTFDVHWNIPQKKWICRVFEDLKETDKVNYSYLQQFAAPQRYTAKNPSVGMGFGYWKVKAKFQGYL